MKFTYQLSRTKYFCCFSHNFFIYIYMKFGQIGLKIIIENRFLTTRRVKYSWKCVATQQLYSDWRKISHWRWVAAEVFGNSWDCLTWKTRCPRSTYLILKRLILKTFFPPPDSRATLEIYTTHAYTYPKLELVLPLVSFPFFALPFTSNPPPLFLSIHSSFLRIHSRIFKFQRNDFSSSVHLFFAESTLESSRYQLYELFIRFESRNKSWQPNVFDSPVSSNYSLFLPSSIQFRVDLIIRTV